MGELDEPPLPVKKKQYKVVAIFHIGLYTQRLSILKSRPGLKNPLTGALRPGFARGGAEIMSFTITDIVVQIHYVLGMSLRFPGLVCDSASVRI